MSADLNAGAAVSLLELLRSVPKDAVLRIDTPNAIGCMDTRSIAVGRICHEAAELLRNASGAANYTTNQFSNLSNQAHGFGAQGNLHDSDPLTRHMRLSEEIGGLYDDDGMNELRVASGVAASTQRQCLRDGVAESVLDTRNGDADWTKAGTGVNSPTSPGLISRKAYTGSVGSNPTAVAPSHCPRLHSVAPRGVKPTDPEKEPRFQPGEET